MTIPQSELESYPLAANVTIRPGTKLVKITTDPKVYAVESNGTLVHVPDEATAIALYGDNWAQRVVDVPDAFFTNYTVSTETVSATAYPEGSLIKTADAADVYYIDATGNARKITTEAAFTSNRFKWGDIITTTLTIPTAGTDLAAADADLIDTSSGAGGVPAVVVGTGLTVALASDTPAAETIPAGSPNAFLKINLTAASDGAVKISTIKLSAYDLGLSTYIDSVTFYDDGVKQGTSKNMNSDRIATFNFSTPIEVAAGTTKSLVVKATIETGQTSGNFALGIASASDVTTDGATVSGSFPIQGNTKAVAAATIGTVTMSSVSTTDTTNNFGEDDVLLGGFNLAVANEAVIWESMRLKNGGTTADGIVGNMRVLIDGDEVVTSVELVGRYVDFDLANHVIAKNDTITVEIYGDIGIANVGNTVKLYFDDANDLVFTGQSYGYGIQIGATGFLDLDTASNALAVTLAAGDVTIDMDKSATPAKDVRPDDNDVVLATISIVSSGENATITAIQENGVNEFVLSGTGIGVDEIENVELKDVNSGAVYDIAHASSTDTAKIKLTLTDEISLVQGVTKTFELRVDLKGPNDGGVSANDTFQVTLEDGAFTITGDDSDDDLSDNITPTSVTSAVATVKTASLTWTTTALNDKTIVPGAEGLIIYQAGLKAGESSDVTLTSIKLSASTTVQTGFDDNNISQLRLYIDGKLVKTTAGIIVESATVADSITFTSLDTTNRVIPAGASVNLEVKADFAGTFNPAAWIELAVTESASSIVCKDKDNNNVVETISNEDVVSRTIKLVTVGTLKVELDITDQKANANTINLAGTNRTSGDKYLGKLKFTTANESIKITDLALGQEGTAESDDILTVDLYDINENPIASEAVSSVAGSVGAVHFSELDLILPADSTTKYYIGVTTRSINALGDASGTADHDETIKFTMASSTVLSALGLSDDEAVKAIGVDSSESITIVEDTETGTTASVIAGEYSGWGFATTTIATISGSVLTGITNAMSDTTLNNGIGRTIGKYTFVFDNGSNRIATGTDPVMAELTTMILNIATTSGVHVADVQAYIGDDTSNKTDAVQFGVAVANEATIDFTTLDGDTEEVDGVVTITIAGTISGVETSDSVQTELDNLTTDFTYDGYDGWDDSKTANVLLTISEVLGGTLSN